MKTKLIIECTSKKEAAFIKGQVERLQSTFRILRGSRWTKKELEELRKADRLKYTYNFVCRKIQKKLIS